MMKRKTEVRIVTFSSLRGPNRTNDTILSM